MAFFHVRRILVLIRANLIVINAVKSAADPGMTTNDDINVSDRYLSYIAGVLLALVSSAWLADGLVMQIARVIPFEPDPALQVNIAAGLFFGISFSNPIGSLIAKTPWKRSMYLLVGGFLFGLAAQPLLITPIAGASLSNFLHLLLAAAMVPLAICTKRVNVLLVKRGIQVSETLARYGLTVARLPDRVLFILLMSASFAAFWRFAATTQQVLITLTTVLTLLTAVIAMRKFEDKPKQEICPDFQTWLDLEPEEPVSISLVEQAMAEIRKLVRTMLPGAILFGGLIRLVVDALTRLFPDLADNLQEPGAMWQTLGMVAASGLGLVLLGIVLALGFSLMLLQIIGRLRNWTDIRLRENCYRLMRMLYFRPMKRS